MRREHAEALEFVAHASHDMRQPLMSVLTYVELIAREGNPEQLAQLRDRMRLAAHSLRSLCEDFLDTYRMFGAELDAETEIVPISDLFARIEAETRPLALAKGLVLRIAATGARTRTVPALLDRVLCNLVGNAIRHTEQGGVLVGVRRVGADYRIEVIDTGPGLNADARAALLDCVDRFGVSESGETHGLGFNIIKRLCGVLHHSVGARSRAGGGTVFSVIVPRVVVRGAGRCGRNG